MFNKNKYVLNSRRTISGISQILDANTLDRETLKREKTEKPFIGQVGDDSFYIISSSPIGVCCAIGGIIKLSENNTTQINIETKLPKTFTVLFSVWTILTAGAFVFNISKHGPPTASAVISFIIMIVLFRLLLAALYSRARNLAIKQIEQLVS
jgi:hypothetical protein